MPTLRLIIACTPVSTQGCLTPPCWIAQQLQGPHPTDPGLLFCTCSPSIGANADRKSSNCLSSCLDGFYKQVPTFSCIPCMQCKASTSW